MLAKKNCTLNGLVLWKLETNSTILFFSAQKLALDSCFMSVSQHNIGTQRSCHWETHPWEIPKGVNYKPYKKQTNNSRSEFSRNTNNICSFHETESVWTRHSCFFFFGRLQDNKKGNSRCKSLICYAFRPPWSGYNKTKAISIYNFFLLSLHSIHINFLVTYNFYLIWFN